MMPTMFLNFLKSSNVEHNIFNPKIINAIDNLQPLTAKQNISKNDTYSKKDFYIWLKCKGIELI
jgi:hypothetical protein